MYKIPLNLRAKPLHGLSPPGTISGMSEPVVVTVQARGRVNLGQIATFSQYIVHSQADGTIVLEPATVISLTEQKLMIDTALMTSIAESRAHPERLTTRDRSNSPRV